MKINFRRYDVDDLIKIISDILNGFCCIKTVKLNDSFFKYFNINKVAKFHIIKAVQSVLNCELTLDEIDSVNNLVIIYQNTIEDWSIFDNFNDKDIRIFKEYE